MGGLTAETRTKIDDEQYRVFTDFLFHLKHGLPRECCQERERSGKEI